MPVRYLIDKEQRLVLTTGEGIVTFTEMKEHQDRLLADPDLDPKFDQLVDFATVTGLVISIEEANAILPRGVQ